MKNKILLTLSMVALGATCAYAGMGAGTGLQGSNHDMTHIIGATADNQQRVCAFCHTPHHADQSGNLDYNPLWAHAVTTQTFTPYASLTLDAAIDPASFLAGPSKLCMSCHDGVIAADQHYGGTAGGGAFTMTGDAFGQYAVGTGGDLSNDHPIGFNYIAVANGGTGILADAGVGPAVAGKDNYIKLANSPYIDNINPTTGVRTPTANGLTIADRLYGTTTFTCATCHDVHNKKTVNAGGGVTASATPNDQTGTVALTNNKNYFLLGGQVGSAICLSCHIK
jgi:hypothetical protein